MNQSIDEKKRIQLKANFAVKMFFSDMKNDGIKVAIKNYRIAKQAIYQEVEAMKSRKVNYDGN